MCIFLGVTMATLKVNFVFTTNWTANSNNFAVAEQLKTALTNAQAYNIVRDSICLDKTIKPATMQHTVTFDVTVVSNAKATTKHVTQALEAFIDAVDASNVKLDITHNLFNTAYRPSQSLVNFNTLQ